MMDSNNKNDNTEPNVDTGGGTFLGGNAQSGGDFVGRDSTKTGNTFEGINIRNEITTPSEPNRPGREPLISVAWIIAFSAIAVALIFIIPQIIERWFRPIPPIASLSTETPVSLVAFSVSPTLTTGPSTDIPITSPTPELSTDRPTSSRTPTPTLTLTLVAPTIAIPSNERGVALGFTMEQQSNGNQEAILAQIVDQYGVIYQISQRPRGEGLSVSVFVDFNRDEAQNSVLGCNLNSKTTFNKDGWNWIFVKIIEGKAWAAVNDDKFDNECDGYDRNQMLNSIETLEQATQNSKGVSCFINEAVAPVLGSYRLDSQTCP